MTNKRKFLKNKIIKEKKNNKIKYSKSNENSTEGLEPWSPKWNLDSKSDENDLDDVADAYEPSEQVEDIFIENDIKFKTRYGIIGEKDVKFGKSEEEINAEYKQRMIQEESNFIDRVEKSPVRTIFTVDLGNDVPEEKVKEKIESYKSNYNNTCKCEAACDSCNDINYMQAVQKETFADKIKKYMNVPTNVNNSISSTKTISNKKLIALAFILGYGTSCLIKTIKN